MLVTNYTLYHVPKLRDSEELILNPKLMKEVKLRKLKLKITQNKKFLIVVNQVFKLVVLIKKI